MYKIIGGDQKEYGPVAAEQLRQWIAEGRLGPQSFIWSEGSNEWKPLASLPEFAEALRLQPGGISTGARPMPTPIPTTPSGWTTQILGRQPELDVGRCLASSWKLLTANFGLLAGGTAIIWVIGVIGQVIPVAGIAYWVFRGVFYGGLYLLFLKRIRGEPASIGQAFAGFRVGPAQLLLAGIVSSLLSWLIFCCCFMLPSIYFFVAWIFAVPLVADKGLEFWSAMELSRKVVTRVWFQVLGLAAVAFLPFILTYLFVQTKISLEAYSSVFELMKSGQLDFPRIMKFTTELAQRSLPLIAIMKVVLLLNLPFALGALMYAYESLFGTRTAPTA